ncbi:hypothetical protein [Sphingomonas abaci]|uniref:Uncharacterized protein n=1 Tax=Sphingomonas abaci TaxID=237611 RepID=A0A7W7AKZ9_9SPHN|nr:hypothetical protein [Sphingomonas abaci]MBB4618982.1 hypothetical protein [Sphingomonas abaci]
MAAKTGAAAATTASASVNPRPAHRIAPTTLSPAATPVDDGKIVTAERKAATDGCRALLRAQLKAGAHWLRDPRDFAAACASVGLLA